MVHSLKLPRIEFLEALGHILTHVYHRWEVTILVFDNGWIGHRAFHDGSEVWVEEMNEDEVARGLGKGLISLGLVSEEDYYRVEREEKEKRKEERLLQKRAHYERLKAEFEPNESRKEEDGHGRQSPKDTA